MKTGMSANGLRHRFKHICDMPGSREYTLRSPGDCYHWWQKRYRPVRFRSDNGSHSLPRKSQNKSQGSRASRFFKLQPQEYCVSHRIHEVGTSAIISDENMMFLLPLSKPRTATVLLHEGFGAVRRWIFCVASGLVFSVIRNFKAFVKNNLPLYARCRPWRRDSTAQRGCQNLD